MLIAEFDRDTFQIKTILDLVRIPRLGKGIGAGTNLPPDSINKAVSILTGFRQISAKHGSEKIIATATSFLRDAKNRDDMLNAVEDKIRIKIEILTGQEEARWSFWGGICDRFKVQGLKFQVGIIDIGGGSTEIITCEDFPNRIDRDILHNLPIKSVSIDVGSVRIKERFLNEQPPSAEKINEAEDFINEKFAGVNVSAVNMELTGVAGTITTLGAIKLGLKNFEKDKIDNLELTINDVEEIFVRLSVLELQDIISLGDYMEGRADIILSGILILRTFMRKFGVDTITVSTKGLRYGIFLREVLK